MRKIGFMAVAAAAFSLAPGTATAKESNLQFVQSAWSGLGNIAVVAGNDGISGGKLYTLLDEGKDKKQQPSAHFIADHVMSATFSSDGRWLVVTTVGATRGNVPQNATWLISSDGKQRQKLATNTYTPGAWITGLDTYIYGSNPVYKVTPLHHPVRLPLSLGKNDAVDDIRTSPDGKRIALNVTHTVSKTDPAQRYDVIDLWDAKSSKLQTLTRATLHDGFVLGPWAANSKSLFYWFDPDHSASLLADGARLSVVSLDGKVHNLAQTATVTGSVVPFSGNQAVIQLSGDRYPYVDKSLAVVQGTSVRAVKQPSDTVFISPTANPNGTTVAFLQGPEIHNSPSVKQLNQWSGALKLMTFDTKTGRAHQVAAAGRGTFAPAFDGTGQKILFVRQNTLQWVWAAKGHQSTSHLAATFPSKQLSGVTLQDQLQIVDYVQRPSD